MKKILTIILVSAVCVIAAAQVADLVVEYKLYSMVQGVGV